MRSKVKFQRGDVVLVNFVFAAEAGVKRRPALIVSTVTYHQGRQETVVAAITSNVRRVLMGDQLISDWQRAGLLYPSVVTGIIRTIKQAMVQRKLGTVTAKDLRAVEENLRQVLGL